MLARSIGAAWVLDNKRKRGRPAKRHILADGVDALPLQNTVDEPDSSREHVVDEDPPAKIDWALLFANTLQIDIQLQSLCAFTCEPNQEINSMN